MGTRTCPQERNGLIGSILMCSLAGNNILVKSLRPMTVLLLLHDDHVSNSLLNGTHLAWIKAMHAAVLQV